MVVPTENSITALYGSNRARAHLGGAISSLHRLADPSCAARLLAVQWVPPLFW